MVLEHKPRADLVAMHLVVWVEKVRRVLRDSFPWDHPFFFNRAKQPVGPFVAYDGGFLGAGWPGLIIIFQELEDQD